jgi:transposase
MPWLLLCGRVDLPSSPCELRAFFFAPICALKGAFQTSYWAMTKTKYTLEFKADAIRQVLDLGCPVKQVAVRLGIPDKTLYLWVGLAKRQQDGGADEVAKLRAEGSRLRSQLSLIKTELQALRVAAETISKMYQ